MEETILPEALRGVALGDDVIEVGPGPGLTTDVLGTRTTRLTALEFDPDLARQLAQRLAGTNVDVVCGDATAMRSTFPSSPRDSPNKKYRGS